MAVCPSFDPQRAACPADLLSFYPARDNVNTTLPCSPADNEVYLSFPIPASSLIALWWRPMCLSGRFSPDPKLS